VSLTPFKDQLEYEASAVGAWVDVMQREQSNNRVLVLSAGMYPQFPAINYAHAKMTTPFMTLWPLWGLYETCKPGETGYRPLDKQPSYEAYVFDEVVDGLVKEQPEIVVIDKSAAMLDCSKRPFEYLPYFMRDPRFARELSEHYRPLKTLDHFVFYERYAEADALTHAKGLPGKAPATVMP